MSYFLANTTILLFSIIAKDFKINLKSKINAEITILIAMIFSFLAFDFSIVRSIDFIFFSVIALVSATNSSQQNLDRIYGKYLFIPLIFLVPEFYLKAVFLIFVYFGDKAPRYLICSFILAFVSLLKLNLYELDIIIYLQFSIVLGLIYLVIKDYEKSILSSVIELYTLIYLINSFKINYYLLSVSIALIGMLSLKIGRERKYKLYPFILTAYIILSADNVIPEYYLIFILSMIAIFNYNIKIYIEKSLFKKLKKIIMTLSILSYLLISSIKFDSFYINILILILLIKYSLYTNLRILKSDEIDFFYIKTVLISTLSIVFLAFL